jgi:hypothetical protein
MKPSHTVAIFITSPLLILYDNAASEGRAIRLYVIAAYEQKVGRYRSRRLISLLLRVALVSCFCLYATSIVDETADEAL